MSGRTPPSDSVPAEAPSATDTSVAPSARDETTTATATDATELPDTADGANSGDTANSGEKVRRPGAPWARRPKNDEPPLPPGDDDGLGDESEGPRSVKSLLVALGGTLLILIVGAAGILLDSPVLVGGVLAALSLVYIFHRRLVAWNVLLVALAVVLMIVPIRRYVLVIGVPTGIEAYQAIIAFIAAGILVSLMIDKSFSWRRAALSSGIVLFLLGQVLSVVFNLDDLGREGLMNGSILALVSCFLFAAVFLIVRQLIRSERSAELLIGVLVVLGAFVGFFAALEFASGFNIFQYLHRALPFLAPTGGPTTIERDGLIRAYGSARHPISLGAILCMLLPLAIYKMLYSPWPRTLGWRRAFWLACAACMLVGVVATGSRTPFVVLGIMAVVLMVLRPRTALPLIAIGLPVALLTLLIPADLPPTFTSLFDVDALVESQMGSPGWRGSGRLTDVAPSLQAAADNPLFGTGSGSRITTGNNFNAFILDNQYLGSLLEVGIVGLVGVAALFVVPTVGLVIYAYRRATLERYSALSLALVLAILGYAVSLAFHDAFGFPQSLLVMMMLVGLASWVVVDAPRRVTTATGTISIIRS